MLLDLAPSAATAPAEAGLPGDFMLDLDALAAVLVRRLGNQCTSILLIGAAARGEQTIGPNGKLVSDLDFMVVLPQRHPASVLLAERRCHELLHGYERDVPGRLGEAVSVGFMGSSPRFWLAATPFMYELRANARCMYGSGAVLGWPHIVHPAQIPAWEGIRLIANRLCETLGAYARQDEATAGDPSPALRYALVKQALACSEAALIFAGEYRPSYRERSAAHVRVSHLFNPTQNALVKAAYSAKLGTDRAIFDLDPGAMLHDVIELALHTLALSGTGTPSGIAAAARGCAPAAPGPLADLLFFVSQALRGDRVPARRAISSVYGRAVALAQAMTSKEAGKLAAEGDYYRRAAELYKSFKTAPQVVGTI